MEELKDSITSSVERQSQQLSELSRKIHDNPELGFRETKAVAWLTGYLEGNGFRLERGICELATAFRASYGEGRPVVAILAEYDALPKLGHACGHNIIAGAAAGAAVAARPAIDKFGGSVCVIGTPAEEIYGGKVIIANRGGFNDIDTAMMVHPGVRDLATTQALAARQLDVEFFGRAAHAAARPEMGINALDAMILSFTAINSLRQHIKDGARIHGVITDGGEAANIVPAHSAATFIVRARDNAYLEELRPKVVDCFTGAAVATGARLEHKWDDVSYASLRNNLTLARLFRQNMKYLGRKMPMTDPDHAFGSTDMGNVSHLVPSIHPFIAIAPRDVLAHSPEFAAAAASDAGRKGMLDAAKALAMTVADLLASPELLGKVREEFERGE
ncbi:MAG TPA: M20 family metallopeptidase [Dehalococcoidia bacterium]|nr:M20 family metallopeptidase [Dehalococcoidia bacterium]